jgi:DNA primase large subunit
VLKGIELAKAKGMKLDEADAHIRRLTAMHLGGELATPVSRRNDVISHHILRLAYCQTEEKRKWFLTQECALFRHRLEHQTPEQVADFMSRSNMHLEPLEESERRRHARDITDVWMAQRPPTATEGEWEKRLTSRPIYRIPFLEALELIASRRAFVHGGQTYIPHERLTHIIVGRFRASLSRSLTQAARALPAVLRDERLGPVLGNMSKAYLGPQYGQGASGAGAVKLVHAKDVGGLAGVSFPLCMAAMHRALEDSSHLKHSGRMQYGLFLKGIGLSLEEALVFWQGHFTKRMSGEDFLKKYAYNIRHNYGKEGKRADYTPYNCVKIITGTPPGSGEFHGCPYRHWDQGNVRKALAARGLSASQITDVMASVASRDYQIACRKEFEARMGIEDDGVGQHPNGYFEAAQRVLEARANGKTLETPVKVETIEERATRKEDHSDELALMRSVEKELAADEPPSASSSSSARAIRFEEA